MTKRIISDTTWKSKKVRSIQPPEFRPEYAWLMPLFEDNGVAEVDAESIWSEAYGAARPGWNPENVQQLIDELVRVGLYENYEADGKTFLYLVGSDKPGHLPPPSQRYSTLPLPVAYGKPRQRTAKPTAAQGIAHTGIGTGTGFGSGSGLGDGTGNGTGTEQSASQNRGSVSSHKTHKTEEQEQEQNPNPPRWEIGIGSSALTLLAVTEHLHCVGGMREVRPNDPCLPILVRLTEERLAFQQTQTLTLPPVGWVEPEGQWDEHTTDCWVEVKPGDPRYTKPDQPHMKGALSGREMAATWAYSQFGLALEFLAGLNQYIPELEQEDVPEGTISWSEEDMDSVLRLMGWPAEIFKFDLSMSKIWAVAHWAYKTSNYWPGRLPTLAEFIKRLPTLEEQYDKFYDKLPEGKKPHDLGVGDPRPQAANV